MAEIHGLAQPMGKLDGRAQPMGKLDGLASKKPRQAQATEWPTVQYCSRYCEAAASAAEHAGGQRGVRGAAVPPDFF